MPEPASSSAAGAAVGWGVKSGLAAGFLAIMVSLVTVLVGFTVVPLRKGREMQDAAARLAAGLLCSFALGPPLAYLTIKKFPELLDPWRIMLPGESEQWYYLAAGAPFIAVTGLLGFWLVAGILRWADKHGDTVIGGWLGMLRKRDKRDNGK